MFLSYYILNIIYYLTQIIQETSWNSTKTTFFAKHIKRTTGIHKQKLTFPFFISTITESKTFAPTKAKGRASLMTMPLHVHTRKLLQKNCSCETTKSRLNGWVAAQTVGLKFSPTGRQVCFFLTAQACFFTCLDSCLLFPSMLEYYLKSNFEILEIVEFHII